jgi:hypothetical protein
MIRVRDVKKSRNQCAKSAMLSSTWYIYNIGVSVFDYKPRFYTFIYYVSVSVLLEFQGIQLYREKDGETNVDVVKNQ